MVQSALSLLLVPPTSRDFEVAVTRVAAAGSAAHLEVAEAGIFAPRRSRSRHSA
jgi:hypothetical protein